MARVLLTYAGGAYGLGAARSLHAAGHYGMAAMPLEVTPEEIWN